MLHRSEDAEKRIGDFAVNRAKEIAEVGFEHVLGIPAESISEDDKTRILTIAADPDYHPETDWVFREPEWPRRQRVYVPSAPPELDEHQKGKSFRDAEKADMTGARATLMPTYRRKPPYVTLANGCCVMHMAESQSEDSKIWRGAFARDARSCFVLSHVHKCKNTCFKHKGGGKAGDRIRICRFNFCA